MAILGGLIVGWLKEFTFLGLALIEAFVLWASFNLLAPKLVIYGLVLPITSIGFWHTFLAIVLIHIVGIIVGRFIKAVTPTLVKINTSNEAKSE